MKDISWRPQRRAAKEIYGYTSDAIPEAAEGQQKRESKRKGEHKARDKLEPCLSPIALNLFAIKTHMCLAQDSGKQRGRAIRTEGVWILPLPRGKGDLLGQQQSAGAAEVPGALNQHSKHNGSHFLPTFQTSCKCLMFSIIIQNYTGKGNVVAGKLTECSKIITPV